MKSNLNSGAKGDALDLLIIFLISPVRSMGQHPSAVGRDKGPDDKLKGNELVKFVMCFL